MFGKQKFIFPSEKIVQSFETIQVREPKATLLKK